MKSVPIFHYHKGDKVFPTNLRFENLPTGGIWQTKCSICKKYGFVASQKDRHSEGYRILGQGHSKASRLFNGLPIFGVSLFAQNERYFFHDSKSYIVTLYEECEAIMHKTTLYDNFAVVPIFRDDYAIINGIARDSETERIVAFGMAIAPLYEGVSRKQFGQKMSVHLQKLVEGFSDPVATIPRINLGGKVQWL